MSRQRKLPAGMTLRGKVYYANFRAQGRRVQKRLSSDFSTAKELLNDLRSRSDRADFGLVDNDYLWKDLREEFFRWARQSIRASEGYETDLNQIEEYQCVRSIRQINHAFVFGFRQWRLGQGVGPRTVNRAVDTLGNMPNKGVAWGRIGENTIASIKPLPNDEPRKKRRSLSVEEVQALSDASPDYLLPVWRFFMVTGVRSGELARLKFTDIDFERGAVTIPRTSKNHKEREIPLDDEMLATITRLRDEAPSRLPVPGKTLPGRLSRDHVFVNGANTPWYNNLLRTFYTWCKRADIEGADSGGSVDLHSLRVTFTTLALEGGAAPKAIQEILGHSTLAMTMCVYAKATDRTKRDAISALPFAKSSSPEHVIPLQNGPKVDPSNSEEPETLCFTG